MTAYLCIGGHMDGRWYESPDDERKEVKIATPYTPPLAASFDPAAAVESVSISYSIYKKIPFCADGQETFIWAGQSWTPFGVLKALIRNYKRSPND